MDVTFFYPYPDELAHLDQLDLLDYEFWSHEGKERRRAWILQTYLWMRHYGYEVQISSSVPSHGAVVLLPEPPILRAFHQGLTVPRTDLFIVTVRADVLEYRHLLADIDVTQNGRFADERHTFFVPHWPQPGLLPRDPSRGERIEHIVFKGGFGSLKDDFRSPEWYDALDRRGLHFHMSCKEVEGEFPNWHDYRTADLNLAVRPSFHDGGLRYEKPASKLVNAWHAGVPSLLGKEYAFLELKKSDLDYVEVTSAEEALSIIDQLRSDPRTYRRMIDHGHERAQAFTTERIASRWAEVLFEHAPQRANTRAFQWAKSVPLPIRRVLNFLHTPPKLFELRKQIGVGVRSASGLFTT